MKKIKVLIVDDHAVVRTGLTTILGFEDDIDVVGEARDGLEALERSKALKPDVVIMDLMMPTLNGIDATQRISRQIPQSKVLILTTYGSSDDLRAALTAGAYGAVMKTVSNEDLLSAIRTTASGGRYLSPEIEKLLVTSPPTPKLTQRQSEILASVTRGLTNDDIALQFGITASGVKQHLSAIFAKLGVSNRTEAIAFALRKHILKL